MQTEQLSTLETFESGLSKSDIKNLAISAVDKCLESGNVLQVAEALSGMETFIKEVKSDSRFKEYAREEIAKHKVFNSPSGAKIELAETGTNYDYLKCGDWEIELIESQLLALKEKLETRQKFLKNLPIEGIDIVDSQTGELIHVFPPAKSSTSSYKITLAK